MVQRFGARRLSRQIRPETAKTSAMRLPKCRLFLVAPAGIDPQLGKKLAAAALAAGDVATLLLPAGPQQLEFAKLLKPLSHAHDTALLLEGDPVHARELGLDGVQLQADVNAYTGARAIIGNEAIVGADCGSSRHLAMTMGELGADYIGFSGLMPAEEGSIIGWWSELFEVPCVALDPAGESDARIFLAEGADFIRPADDMWQDMDTAARAVKTYNVLIGELLR
jgi:thiamine-phosphate pyrophosphorylase